MKATVSRRRQQCPQRPPTSLIRLRCQGYQPRSVPEGLKKAMGFPSLPVWALKAILQALIAAATRTGPGAKHCGSQSGHGRNVQVGVATVTLVALMFDGILQHAENVNQGGPIVEGLLTCELIFAASSNFNTHWSKTMKRTRCFMDGIQAVSRIPPRYSKTPYQKEKCVNFSKPLHVN